MATSPTSGPGGGSGSGLPSQWTAGSHGDVTAETDDGTRAPLLVQGLPAQTGAFFSVMDDGGNAGIEIDGDGAGGIDGFTLSNADGALLSGSSGGNAELSAGTGQTLFLQAFSGALKLTAARIVQTGLNAAPADGTLAAGDFALWLDKTNGAGKLMVKAKTTDGTVVTAAVALA